MADATLSSDMDAFLITANDAAARTELGAASVAVYAAAQINDSGGNELLKLTATASAVNELTLANAATGNNPTITPSGGDANIGLTVQNKGTGVFTVKYDTANADYGKVQSWFGDGGTETAYMRADGMLYCGSTYGMQVNQLYNTGGGQVADLSLTFGGANAFKPLAFATPGPFGFEGAQALSGAGAVNVTTTATKFTSTGAAQALTLADGADGQIKIITHVVDGGSGVLTPTTKTGFSTLTFTNAGDTATLQFNTTIGWVILSTHGTVVA